jgi:PAS domain S-box-containing protein
LIENASDGIALIDHQGQFLYVSPSGRRNFGYAVDEEILVSPNDVTHPEDLPVVLDTLNKIMQDPTEKPILEYRFRHKDGSYRWIESTFNNLLYEASVQAIVINFRDITSRREAELKVQEQLDELRRWHANTLGREMRVIELKEEVNRALIQAGLPPRYQSTPLKEQSHE